MFLGLSFPVSLNASEIVEEKASKRNLKEIIRKGNLTFVGKEEHVSLKFAFNNPKYIATYVSVLPSFVTYVVCEYD